MQALRPSVATVAALAPGVALSAIVAVIGYVAAPYVARVVPIPNMVIALVVGIALNPLAARPAVQPGMDFCVKTLLRWAVALLGLRVGLGDIAALGAETAILIVIAMAATVASGFIFARWSAQAPGFGALVGVGTAVCGASATLAASTVVPEYKGKKADIAFVVVAVNALATLAMLVYPPLCIFLGFDAQATGVMLGGTIHDVAQVVGAGYAVSDAAGNTAVSSSCSACSCCCRSLSASAGISRARACATARRAYRCRSLPSCSWLLCLVNSAVPLMPSVLPVYAPVKRAGGGFDLGPAARDRRARSRHVGKDHHRAWLAARDHGARRQRVIFVLVTGGLLLMRVV